MKVQWTPVSTSRDEATISGLRFERIRDGKRVSYRAPDGSMHKSLTHAWCSTLTRANPEVSLGDVGEMSKASTAEEQAA